MCAVASAPGRPASESGRLRQVAWGQGRATASGCRYYDLTLTIDGLNYRLCPAHPAAPGSTRPPHGGGSNRSISRRSTKRS